MRRRFHDACLAGLLLLVGCGGGGSSAAEDPASRTGAPTAATFTNPIVAAARPGGSADPSVVYQDGHYHYCRSVGNRAIGIARARRLQDIGTAPLVTVWTAPPGTAWSDEVWAPELQYLRGRWYVYFAASDGRNATHRMYVLEGETQDAQGAYAFKGRVAAPGDAWAIDGVALEHEHALYFVWSGLRDDARPFPQVLYIAPMSDPWTVSGERQEIAAPDQAWEQVGAALLEGPAVLQREGALHLAYSASGSWTDDYALGLLTYRGGDILNAASWVKSSLPSLAKRPEAGVWGPGHNAFVRSPDGREDWIVYHGIDVSGGGWEQRSVRAQPFGWSPDGRPDFGRPVGPGVPLAQPSGTPGS
ncbi:MAG TPA: glycoside hydrolase family 43 protein [Caldimonas sp.]|jgi:GH43 family beta-xylosidase|nr:glycoside hydrolase family 43 protein [Caldimonas sp.]HEX2543071.1 glycoside hydrolase family 43 protein [Caldimonas sp.]